MKVFMLLDRSGSMSSLWSEAIGSINGYVEKLTPDTQVHLALFDSQSYDVLRDSSASEWQPLGPWDASPRGSTPLLDSFGKLAATAEANDDERTVLVVMTDGQENCSREYSYEAIKSTIKRLEDRNWPVVFLGADFNNVTQYVGTLGTDLRRTYSASAENLRKGMVAMASNTVAYASAGSASNDWFNVDAETRKNLAA
jgi:hypothetical protein